MSKMVVIGILTVLGISLTGLSFAASTFGWGVDRPKEQAVNEDDDDDGRHYRRTYYGGFYYPFYSRGIRHAGSGISGGGFRAGK